MGMNNIEAVEGNLGEKKALLIGLKHPLMNDVDVKGKILRMKKFLMDLRGFSENNITLLIEDEDREESQPTEFNIQAETCYLVERANPGDILFIHLIAHGCSEGSITSSDKQLIPDSHFRALVRSVVKGCALTIVSDCLIQPENSVCCTLGIPTDIQGDMDRFCINHPTVDDRMITLTFMGFLSTNLSPLDINLEHEPSTSTSTSTITPILKTLLELLSKLFFHKTLHLFSSVLNCIFGLPRKKRSLPSSRIILLNAFQSDHHQKKAIQEDDNIPELFFASSTTTTPPNQHMLYGGFTTTILDILEETHGQVTNVKLAQMAREKLSMQGVSGLHCNNLHHAYASFFGV